MSRPGRYSGKSRDGPLSQLHVGAVLGTYPCQCLNYAEADEVRFAEADRGFNKREPFGLLDERLSPCNSG